MLFRMRCASRRYAPCRQSTLSRLSARAQKAGLTSQSMQLRPCAAAARAAPLPRNGSMTVSPTKLYALISRAGSGQRKPRQGAMRKPYILTPRFS